MSVEGDVGISTDALAGRVGSVLAGATALTHLTSATVGGHGGSMALAHVVMALVCLPCVLCLWSRPTALAWAASMTAGLTMLVVHVWMLASASAAVVASSHHHRTLAGGHDDVYSNVALLLMVLEVGAAAWVLTIARLERESSAWTEARSPAPETVRGSISPGGWSQARTEEVSR